MMVDFGNSVFDGNLPAGTPVVQPVEDKSGLYLAQGLSSTLDNVSSLFSGRAQANADALKNATFSEISDKILLYADAREQGISSDEIHRYLRRDMATWTANNPQLTEDIWTFVNKTLQDNGLGGNINRETPEETGARKLMEEMVGLGWAPSQIDEYKAFKAETSRLEMMTNLWAKRTEGLTSQDKYQGAIALQSLVKSGLPWVETQIKNATDQLARTNDPTARAQIIAKLKTDVSRQTGIIGAARTQSGNAIDTSYLTAGIEGMIAQFEAAANGSIELSALETFNKTQVAKYEMIANLDPRYAQLAALNKATNYAHPNLLQELSARGAEIYAQLGQEPSTNPVTGELTSPKPPDLLENIADIAPVLDTVKSEVENIVKSPDADDQVYASISNKIDTILRSAERYGQTESDPTNFNGIVQFLSDPTIGRYLEQHPEAIKSGTAAAYIIEQQYDAKVLPLINERWATAQKLIDGQIPASYPFGQINPNTGESGTDLAKISDVIEPVWNGAGIEFIPTEEYRNNASVRDIAKSLNQGNNSIAPVLNQLIRTSAHLSGSTDYEKVYNENYKNRLWEIDEENPPVVPGQREEQLRSNPTAIDNPAELSLTDFNPNELQRIVQQTRAKEPERLLNASSPIEVAQAYLGLNEKDSEAAKVLSAFISRNAGIQINPATTAWCAAFVDAVLGASGSKGTGKLNARSYLAWGIPVDEPQVGDVVVLQRGSGGKNDWRGHVGFYMGENPDGTIRVLGGNQSDSVSEDKYDASKVLGFRRAG